MAIVERKTRYGTRFLALYRDSAGEQKSAGTFGTRKEASAAYVKAKADVLRGVDPGAEAAAVYPKTRDGKMTVAAFAARWIEEHPLSGHGRQSYRRMLNCHVIPRFGTEALDSVSTHDVATWLRKFEAEDKSMALVSKIKTVTSALFQSAAEEGLIDVNPVRGIKLRRRGSKRRKAMTPEQYQAVLNSIPEHYRLVCDLIIGASIRWEEAMALKADDIDGQVLHVGAVLNELDKPHRFEYLERTKTGKGRKIKVRSALADRLRERASKGFILLRPDGRHIDNRYFREFIWIPALKEAGLEDSGFVIRDLRRTSATWIRAGGGRLEAVQNRLGHGSLATTSRYLDEIKDSEDEALAALERVTDPDVIAAG